MPISSLLAYINLKINSITRRFQLSKINLNEFTHIFLGLLKKLILIILYYDIMLIIIYLEAMIGKSGFQLNLSIEYKRMQFESPSKTCESSIK